MLFPSRATVYSMFCRLSSKLYNNQRQNKGAASQTRMQHWELIQEDQVFKAIFVYTLSLRLAWATCDPSLKQKKKQ